MLNEIPLLRAPENRRTGMEINPKVRYPDQTEAAIVPLRIQESWLRVVLHTTPKTLRCHKLANRTEV
jgi:hypothetical protein